MNTVPPDSGTDRRFSPLRVVIAVALALFIISLVMGCLFIALSVQHSRRPAQRVTLADGTKIEFVGTAAGNQAFSSETPWLKRVRKILPASLQQRWLPKAFNAACGYGSNSITVYFRVTRPSPPNVIPWSDYEAEDDAGFRYRVSGGYCSFGISGVEQGVGVTLAAYPRRQKDFLFHLRDSRGVVLGTFHLINTNTGPFPDWQPLPLPQTVTNGTESLTLQSVEQRRYGSNSLYLSPKWEYHPGQPGWSNARVRYWTCQDATGNDGSILSLREPAWKIHAQVMRENETNFSAAETFTLANLPVQTTNEFVAIDQSNVVSGVSINVSVLCGPGTFAETNSAANGISRGMIPSQLGSTGSSSSSMGSGSNQVTTFSWGAGTNSYFLVKVANFLPNDEIRFFVHDDLGREVKVPNSGWGSSSTSATRIYQPQFKPLPDARSLTLKVVVDRPKIFDFLIDPKDVKPAAR